MQEFVTHSREETVAVGRELAKTLPAGALIAFTGGLGAGKTAFCQGLAEGLGCTDPVSSPTFAIVNYYRGPRPFAHFDLYRIHTEGDLAADIFDEMAHFFAVYKALEGKEAVPGDVNGRAAAVEVIQRAIDHYVESFCR